MFRYTGSFAGLLVLAVAAVLPVSNPVAADQQGWPLNPPPTQGGFSSGPAYGMPSTYAPVYPPAVEAPATPQTEVRSFYPSAVAEQYRTLSTPFTGNQPVRINLLVPANAQVAFDGAKTMQSGAIRAFVSPPVAPGRDYHYTVTAKWQEGGREITRTQRLTVHAGDVVNVKF